MRIVVFFGLFVLLLFAIDAAVNHGLRSITTGSFGISNRIVRGSINADIVISGSSRALTHYDSRLISRRTGLSTFNIGRNGSQTDMQVAVLRTYLAHNPPPRLVVHNLDSFSFVTSDEIYDPAQYFPYLDQPAIYAAILKIHPTAWKWKHLPLYSYVVDDMRFTWIIGLAAFFGYQASETHFDGFLPRDQAWTGDFDRFRAANPDGVRFEITPAGRADMADLIETCRSHGIPLLFVYSPVYHGMQQIEASRAEVFAEFEELSHRYDVSVWDYSDSPISMDRGLFYNSQHLNVVGAAAFSQDFADRLARSDLLGPRAE